MSLLPPGTDFEALDSRQAVRAAAEARLAEARAAGFADGFEAGRTHARQQADAATEARRTALATALERLTFTHAEARGHVFASLRDFLRVLADRLLPAAALAGLRATLEEEAMRLATAGTGQDYRLRAHPEMAALLAEQGLPPGLWLTEDADLPEGAVVLCAAGGETVIDLDGAARTLAGRLQALARTLPGDDIATRTETHG